jgi:hypothetical protein
MWLEIIYLLALWLKETHCNLTFILALFSSSLNSDNRVVAANKNFFLPV